MISRAFSPKVLVIATAVIEAGLFVWTGVIRHATQGMAPHIFDLTLTGNALAAAFLLIMLVTCARLFFRKDISHPGASVLAACALAALAIIAIHTALPIRETDLIYSLFGIVQLCAIGLASSLVSRDETHLLLRSAQHTAIIIVFLFSATILYGFVTPTDVPSDHHADAAVILGAAVWSHNRPSPLLRMRIAKADDLLRSTIVNTIVCTGSNALGERPEAVVERTELMKLGVDSSAIITESRTNSTIAQVLYLRDSLQPRGFHSFVIVSDHFHLQRALEMCRFNGISARGAASESLLPWALLTWYRMRDAAALLLYWVFGA